MSIIQSNQPFNNKNIDLSKKAHLTEPHNLPSHFAFQESDLSELDNDLVIKSLNDEVSKSNEFQNSQPLQYPDGTLSVNEMSLFQNNPEKAVLLAANGLEGLIIPSTSEKIGVVTTIVEGPVTIIQGADDTVRIVSQGEPVYLNDVIMTAERSYVKITLIDNTTFQLGPHSRASMDKYVYDSDDELGGEFETYVSSGTFRYVSGKISGNNQGQHTVIKTPSAHIGIRGSEVDGKVEQDGSTNILHISGMVSISSRHHTGEIIVYEEGTSVYIPNAALAPSIEQVLPESLPQLREQWQPLNLERAHSAGQEMAPLQTIETAPIEHNEQAPEKAPAQNDEQATPFHDKPVPNDKQPLPSNEKPVPGDKPPPPDQSDSGEDRATPFDDKPVSSDKELTAEEKMEIALEKMVFGEEGDRPSFDQKAVPGDKQPIALDDKLEFNDEQWDIADHEVALGDEGAIALAQIMGNELSISPDKMGIGDEPATSYDNKQPFGDERPAPPDNEIELGEGEFALGPSHIDNALIASADRQLFQDQQAMPGENSAAIGETSSPPPDSGARNPTLPIMENIDILIDVMTGHSDVIESSDHFQAIENSIQNEIYDGYEGTPQDRQRPSEDRHEAKEDNQEKETNNIEDEIVIVPIVMAENDAAITAKNTLLFLSAETLLKNDFGKNLKIIAVSNAVNGSVMLTEEGDIQFTPDSDFTGLAHFEYIVENSVGMTEEAIVFVEVGSHLPDDSPPLFESPDDESTLPDPEDDRPPLEEGSEFDDPSILEPKPSLPPEGEDEERPLDGGDFEESAPLLPPQLDDSADPESSGIVPPIGEDPSKLDEPSEEGLPTEERPPAGEATEAPVSSKEERPISSEPDVESTDVPPFGEEPATVGEPSDAPLFGEDEAPITTKQPESSTGPEAPATGEPEPGTGPEAPATGEPEPSTGPEAPATSEPEPGTGPEAPATAELEPGTRPEAPATSEPEPDTGPEDPTTSEPGPGTGPEAPATSEPEPGTGTGTGPEDPTTSEPEPGTRPEAPATSEPGTGPEAPATSEPEPGTGSEAPATSEPEPGTGPEAPATSEPGTGSEAPATSEPEPGTGPEAPATSEPEPDTGPEAPTTSEPEPGTGPEAPATSEPEPGTRPEAPATSEPEPSTGPEAPATTEPEPSTGPEAPATTEPEPGTGSETPATSEPEAGTGPEAPATTEAEPDTGPEAPATSEPEPSTGPEAPATTEPEPDTGPEAPATSEPEPSTGPEAPATSEPEPSTGPEAPATSEPEPDTGPEAPATSEPEPSTGPEAPATTEPEPDTGPETPPADSPTPRKSSLRFDFENDDVLDFYNIDRLAPYQNELNELHQIIKLDNVLVQEDNHKLSLSLDEVLDLSNTENDEQSATPSTWSENIDQTLLNLGGNILSPISHYNDLLIGSEMQTLDA